MKDYSYVALFDKEDYSTLQRLAEKVRITHNQDLVNEFNNMLESRWNDKKTNYLIDPFDVSKSDPDDLVVNAGIDQCIAQVLGTSTTRWRYMGRGTSTNPPISSDTALAAEVLSRIDMTTNGWIEFASSTLRFMAIGGESTATITIGESGIFTAATVGIMLNHDSYANYPLTHSVNSSVFVISSIVEFVPVA